MPLPVAHACLGVMVISASRPGEAALPRVKLLLAAAVIAILPDFDFLFEWVLHLSPEWHRGFSHSLIFAALAGIGASVMLRSFLGGGYALPLTAAAASHGLLDAATTLKPQDGVELLWPFSSARFAFGFYEYLEFDLSPRYSPLRTFLKALLVKSFAEFVLLVPLVLFFLFLLHRYATPAVRENSGMPGSPELLG